MMTMDGPGCQIGGVQVKHVADSALFAVADENSSRTGAAVDDESEEFNDIFPWPPRSPGGPARSILKEGYLPCVVCSFPSRHCVWPASSAAITRPAYAIATSTTTSVADAPLGVSPNAATAAAPTAVARTVAVRAIAANRDAIPSANR